MSLKDWTPSMGPLASFERRVKRESSVSTKLAFEHKLPHCLFGPELEQLIRTEYYHEVLEMGQHRWILNWEMS